MSDTNYNIKLTKSEPQLTIHCEEKTMEKDIIVQVDTSLLTAASLNIHYGSETPISTEPLWVKLNNEPNKVEVVNSVSKKESIETLSVTLPTRAYSIASATVGAKIYLFGGWSSSNGRLNTINVFDTETNTISTLSATLPTATSSIASGVVGTKIYLFGGYVDGNYVSTIRVFDTVTNTIETLSTTLPRGAEGIASEVIGKKVYLFGGRCYGSNYSLKHLDTINVFDTETNTISTLSTTLPTGADRIASGVVGTKVYLFGGYSVSINNLNTINVFDTVTNTIETLSTTLPRGTEGIASGVIGTKVYLFGGNSTLRTINVFDTVTNTIETLSTTLPRGADEIASGVVEEEIYLFGGYGPINTINKFYFSDYYTVPNGTLFLLNQLGGKEVSIVKNNAVDIKILVSSALLGNSNNEGEEVEYSVHNGTEWS